MRCSPWFTPLPPTKEALFSNFGKSLVQVLMFLWPVGLTAKPLQVGGSYSRMLLPEVPMPLPLPQDYIAVKEKYAKYLPHSAGRYAAKRFRKAQCPIVERLTNSMMMHGRNNGKKLMTVRIVKHAFEIIHLLTGEVGPQGLWGTVPL